MPLFQCNSNNVIFNFALISMIVDEESFFNLITSRVGRKVFALF